MPAGLLVLLFLSVLVFRRARAAGRRGMLWVALLWMTTIAMGFVGCAVGLAFTLCTADSDLSESELRSALRLPAAIGMLLGAIYLTGRAKRPLRA